MREKDGTDSHLIRLGPEGALRIGLNAIAEYLDAEEANTERLEWNKCEHCGTLIGWDESPNPRCLPFCSPPAEEADGE